MIADVDGRAVAVESLYVGANLTQVFGVSPTIGRRLSSDDELQRWGHTAILTDRGWDRLFQRGAHVIGKVIRLRSVMGEEYEARTVVGAGFPRGLLQYPDSSDVLLPARLGDTPFAPVLAYARLSEGASLRHAVAELQSVGDSCSRLNDLETGRLSAVSLDESLFGWTRPYLTLLIAVAGALTLVAVGNGVNLLTAVTAARGHELAVKGALGASRARLLWELVLAQIPAAVLAGVVGAASAHVGATYAVRALSARVLADLGSGGGASVAVCGFVMGWAVIIVVTAVSSLSAVRRTVDGTWQASRSTGPAASTRGRTVVGAQAALVFPLVTVAALLIGSVWRLASVPYSFDPAATLTVEVKAPLLLTRQRPDYLRDVVQKVAALPNVDDVGTTAFRPLSTGGMFEGRIDGERPLRNVVQVWVDERFLRVVNAPLFAGRGFDPRTDAKGNVAIVNEAFLRRTGRDHRVVGRNLVSGKKRYEIIGVVRDLRGRVRDDDMPLSGSAGSQAVPTVYRPLSAVPPLGGATQFLVVKTRDVDPGSLVRAVQAVMRQQLPDVAVVGVETVAQTIRRTWGDTYFLAILVTILCGASLALGLVGVYGVSHLQVVGQRPELGLRISLGASSAILFRMVVWRSMRPVILAVPVGVLLAWAASQLLAKVLFDVSPVSPWALVVAAAACCAMAVCGASVPAWLASKVEPVQVLRGE